MAKGSTKSQKKKAVAKQSKQRSKSQPFAEVRKNPESMKDRQRAWILSGLAYMKAPFAPQLFGVWGLAQKSKENKFAK